MLKHITNILKRPLKMSVTQVEKSIPEVSLEMELKRKSSLNVLIMRIYEVIIALLY